MFKINIYRIRKMTFSLDCKNKWIYVKKLDYDFIDNKKK